MTILNGFPMVSQLTTITDDGQPSDNAQMDCVAASICAAVMFLKGVKAVDAEYNPDLFKDKAYSDSYVGATDASKYVAYCASLGVHLYPASANPAHLVALAHQYLAEGKPVIFTEPDPYVSASLGWTHVCVFYADAPGTLIAMDPYIARPVSRTDAEWTQLLQFNQIWIAEIQEEPKPMELPSNWHLSADGQTLYCKNIDPRQPDVPVQFGFKDFVLPRLQSGEWLNEDVFLAPQYYAQQLEYSDADLGDGDQILSLFGRMLCYPHNPKGAVAHLKNTVVLEYTGLELQRWKSQFERLYQLYQADEAKLAAQPVAVESAQLADLQQRLSVISGLVSQATPILQHIGTAATVK